MKQDPEGQSADQGEQGGGKVVRVGERSECSMPAEAKSEWVRRRCRGGINRPVAVAIGLRDNREQIPG